MHIENYLNVIDACRFCFMCRHLDPVGNVTFREADTPRGRALICTIPTGRYARADWSAWRLSAALRKPRRACGAGALSTTPMTGEPIRARSALWVRRWN